MRTVFLTVIATLSVFVLVPAVTSAQPPEEPNKRGSFNRPDNSKNQNRNRSSSRSEEARIRAEERKKEIKERVQNNRLQIRRDVCERKHQEITKNMPIFFNGASSVKKTLDTVYERVLGFYENSRLTVDNYSELVGNVEIAKVNAEAAMGVLENQTFSVNCSDLEIGQKLDSHRLAVRDTKEALKVYKKTLIDLISSMRSSSAENSDNSQQPTEGSQESE